MFYPIYSSKTSQSYSSAPHGVGSSECDAALEAATALDRAYFASNPRRELYAREAIGPELGHMQPFNDDDVIVVFVERLGPERRTRCPRAVTSRRVKAVISMRESQLRRQ